MKRTASPSLLEPLSSAATPHSAKKIKLLDDFAKISPFPDHPRPTPAEARDVHNLLSRLHSDISASRKITRPTSNSAQTCGNTPNVIDALIGTILSQNTSGKNSTRAKSSLDSKFGKCNFSAIAKAPQSDVIEAIRSGGLANKKAATIQSVLHSIFDKYNDYSLQHLCATEESGTMMTDDEIMKELVSFSGVGPKTASCVLLFCIGRESFAVDTHVYRLSKLLGWVPPSADRIRTQAHLDLRIPPELKYGLHVLMIRHGRTCKGCNGRGTDDKACALREYVKARDSEV